MDLEGLTNETSPTMAVLQSGCNAAVWIKAIDETRLEGDVQPLPECEEDIERVSGRVGQECTLSQAARASGLMLDKPVKREAPVKRGRGSGCPANENCRW